MPNTDDPSKIEAISTTLDDFGIDLLAEQPPSNYPPRAIFPTEYSFDWPYRTSWKNEILCESFEYAFDHTDSQPPTASRRQSSNQCTLLDLLDNSDFDVGFSDGRKWTKKLSVGELQAIRVWVRSVSTVKAVELLDFRHRASQTTEVWRSLYAEISTALGADWELDGPSLYVSGFLAGVAQRAPSFE